MGGPAGVWYDGGIEGPTSKLRRGRHEGRPEGEPECIDDLSDGSSLRMRFSAQIGWRTAAPERTTRQLMRGTSDECRQISLWWTVHRLSGQVYLARDGSTALRNPLWAVNESCRRKLSLAYAREA